MVRRVLIVDDSPEDREMVTIALKRNTAIRHEVTEIGDGQSALDLLQSDPTRFDLIVLDYRLPDMNARQFLEQFLAGERVPPLPIVMLTGSFSDELPTDVHLKAGVQDFFDKGEVNPELLTRITANAIGRHKLLKRLDESERVALEARAAAEEARVTAEAASRAKTQFLTMISHELRTPLTAILGFTDLLKENPGAEDANEMLTMMSHSGSHLAELLDDLIDMAKVEANTLDLDLSRCDIQGIVRETCHLLSIRASEKGLTLSHTDNGGEHFLRTDPIRFRQVVVNLIGNAIKFTDNGGVRCEFSAPEVGPIAIRVGDTGPGIPESLRESIFTPFVQGGQSGEQRQGIGLGLAISKRLASMLGGDLVIESTSESGTTFCFTCDSLQDGASPSDQAAVGLHDDDQAAPNLSGFRILVAEDMPANRYLIKKLLQPTSAEIEFAGNGREALEMSVQGGRFPKPDLIIMDMMMPEMDGFEATAELRRLRFDSPIVALTAATSGQDHSRCLNCGCDDVVTKPIDVPSLYRSLRQRLLC